MNEAPLVVRILIVVFAMAAAVHQLGGCILLVKALKEWKEP